MHHHRSDDDSADHHDPVMWSPPALLARLQAERALEALPRRPRGIAAEARAGIRRIVRLVERGLLPLSDATVQLQQLTERLRASSVVEPAERAPHSWELLRTATGAPPVDRMLG